MSSSHDVVVVGGGPGGYAAALYGAAAGLDVALVEKHKVGGTCLHVGCIPAKELLETAAVYRTVAHADRFGVKADSPVLDMGAVQARKQKIVDQLHRGVGSLLEGRKVTVVDGLGTLGADPSQKSVSVSGGASGDTTLTADHVILATGSVPRTLAGFEVDGERVMTSDELLSITDVPEATAVIGGGAIGLEFASLLADMGSQVTVLEALPRILMGADGDVAKLLTRAFKKRKIDIRTGVGVSGCSRTDSGVAVDIDGQDPLVVDAVAVCVGRRPFTDGLGLEAAGVATDDGGYVEVDEFCRASVPGVYAVGDVIRTPQLAHVAFAEAMVVVKHLLGESPTPVDYPNVPWAIYCHPEVAFVGHTEASATEAGIDVVTSVHRFSGNGRAMIVGETDGLVKVIAARNDDGTGGRILGVHMVGPWVTEQLGQGYLTVNWEATAAEVAEFVQPHPTMSELFGESVLSLTGRALH
ncbi:dihydrolipoyl dehydrogenase [Candidatus Poriferisocius sp.]|uniref:dihydrolipoyl dehydrogenase n=1 Tax=Candidatus Poriferisocius sp. TaxID=3101276 RepID=UPI003B5A3CFE